jgi:hypothetical protein
MLAKTISLYDGPWVDAEAVSNPTTEQAASSMNRIGEDCAQMTRTSSKVMVRFATSTTGVLPASIAVVDSTSQWGEGVSYAPTIAKTATGTYTITYATSYDDGLVGTEGNEAVEETEEVSFRFVWGGAIGSTFGHVQGNGVNNVLTAYVFDAAGVLSDLGGGVAVQIFAR